MRILAWKTTAKNSFSTFQVPMRFLKLWAAGKWTEH